jgi:hypothetical protein
MRQDGYGEHAAVQAFDDLFGVVRINFPPLEVASQPVFEETVVWIRGCYAIGIFPTLIKEE